MGQDVLLFVSVTLCFLCVFVVFDAIHDHPDSWPFHEEVDESYAPGYFEIIEVCCVMFTFPSILR